MGKRKRKTTYSHSEISFDHTNKQDDDHKQYDPTAFDFEMCCLTYLPLNKVYVDANGYSFDKGSVEKYLENNNTHPFIDNISFSIEDLIEVHLTKNSNGSYIDPVTENVLTPKNKIVMIKQTGNVYDYQTIKEFNIGPNMMIDLLTNVPFTSDDIITIHDSLRNRNLPPDPILLSQKPSNDSDVVKNAKMFVKSLQIKPEDALKPENFWYLARSTMESLHAATNFKQTPPTQRPHAIISTSSGKIIVELDVDYSTLGCINFIGYALRGSYNNVKVAKISSCDRFEVYSKDKVDETVWGTPIAYERDTARMNYKYVMYLLNTGNVQMHITNTSKFALTCKPYDINQNHIIGGVIGGEQIIEVITRGAIYPDGKPRQQIGITSIAIVNNPFPATP